MNRRTFCGAAVIVMALGSGAALATPVCDDNGGNSPYICVDKTGPSPILNTDYRRVYTDAANPDIELLTGNTGWKVWSQASDTDTTPANIGDIKIDASAQSDVFEVKIENATAGPGAANVGSIILSDTTNWTGHSSINGKMSPLRH